MTADLSDSPFGGTEITAEALDELIEVIRRLTNWKIFGTFAATLSTAATAFTSLSGTASQSFTKVGSATDTSVLGILSPAAFKTTTTDTAEWAINDGTTDWRTGVFGFNTASEHMQQGIGGVVMTGLAAGTYTMTVRARNTTSVTGALTVNSGDNISMALLEIAA